MFEQRSGLYTVLVRACRMNTHRLHTYLRHSEVCQLTHSLCDYLLNWQSFFRCWEYNSKQSRCDPVLGRPKCKGRRRLRFNT